MTLRRRLAPQLGDVAAQRSLESITSITNVLGPLLATNLFGSFISDGAPVKSPGAAFFAGSILLLLCLMAARRTFRLVPPTQVASPPAGD